MLGGNGGKADGELALNDVPSRKAEKRIFDWQEEMDQVREALRRPEGTLEFNFTPSRLAAPGDFGSLSGFPIIIGPLYYEVGLHPDFTMRFIHSAPATGTRVAGVDMEPLRDAAVLRFTITWFPTETHLYVGEPEKPETIIQSMGEPSDTRVQVGSDGRAVYIGSAGVQVWGTTIYEHGQQVIKPHAIDAWRETLAAIALMQTASSPEGFFFEIVSGNLSLVMLVTGFEAYCKSRFLEIEEEGIVPDFDALIRRFTTVEERLAGIPELYLANSQSKGVSVVRLVVQSGRIDFQNFQRCNRAYTKAYGLNFGTKLGVQNTSIELIR